MIHLNRIKKFKQKRNNQNSTPDAESSHMLTENLLMMADPFVRDKFLLYKRMAHADRGPSF